MTLFICSTALPLSVHNVCGRKSWKATLRTASAVSQADCARMHVLWWFGNHVDGSFRFQWAARNSEEPVVNMYIHISAWCGCAVVNVVQLVAASSALYKHIKPSVCSKKVPSGNVCVPHPPVLCGSWIL